MKKLGPYRTWDERFDFVEYNIRLLERQTKIDIELIRKAILSPRHAEPLASALRKENDQLRNAVKSGQRAPVRHGGKLPKTAIAAIAVILLENYVEQDEVPGENLVELIRELLGVDLPIISGKFDNEKRTNAVWAFAQHPDLGVRELAKLLEVNPSTIVRWKKDPAFIDRIKGIRQAINVNYLGIADAISLRKKTRAQRR